MNNYPEYVEVKGKKYKINTDFRIALECDRISRSEVGEYEKFLAIIYKLFGEDALNDIDNHEELMQLAIKYLTCNDDSEREDKEPSMDFEQDAGLIYASFMSDYQIDLHKINIHWWGFIDLLKGLTEKCSLNQVRMIREEPLDDKKGKERDKWVKWKKQVELKHRKTKEELEMDRKWEELMRKE